MTTLARLVAGMREAANQRLWETLHGMLTPGQRAMPDELLAVPAGARVSELDRLRHGPVRVHLTTRRGGASWLNMINDQAAGLGGKVVASTPRDSLYVLDVLYDRDGGRRPEMIVTDTASVMVGAVPDISW